MAHDVFISYSSKDKPIADAVCHALESNEIRCWYAPRDIRGGMEWDVAIMRAIAESRVMVYVWTSNSRMSKDVTREVKHAFRQEVVVIPFRLEEIKPAEGLQYYLADVHWLDALPPPFEDHLQRLIGQVHANLGGDRAAEEQGNAEEQSRKLRDERLGRERAEQVAQPGLEDEMGKTVADKATRPQAEEQKRLLARALVQEENAKAEERTRLREEADALRLAAENAAWLGTEKTYKPHSLPEQSRGLAAILSGSVLFVTFGAWQYFQFDTRLADLLSISDSRIARGFFSFLGFLLAIALARLVYGIAKK